MAARCSTNDLIAHPIRRTVTETDNLLFSTMADHPQTLQPGCLGGARQRVRGDPGLLHFSSPCSEPRRQVTLIMLPL